MKHYLHKFQNEAGYETARAEANFYKPAVSLIESNNCVIYDSFWPEMVDLGLPSGILWAAYNHGAYSGSTPESYYAWGELETKDSYDWRTYRYSTPDYNPKGGGSIIKYNNTDNKRILESVDDVMTQLYGPDYSIPTLNDVNELRNGTDVLWVTNYNGISRLNGYKLMKKSDHSIYIFTGSRLDRRF